MKVLHVRVWCIMGLAPSARQDRAWDRMTPEPYSATGVPYGVTATLVSIKVSLPRDILLLLGCSEEIDPFLP